MLQTYQHVQKYNHKKNWIKALVSLDPYKLQHIIYIYIF